MGPEGASRGWQGPRSRHGGLEVTLVAPGMGTHLYIDICLFGLFFVFGGADLTGPDWQIWESFCEKVK